MTNQFIRFPIQIIDSGIIEFMLTQHFRVYACLDSHKNRQWQSFPSLATIRKETKICIRVIQAAIKDLVEWGLIKKAHIKRERGRGYRIIYTIIKEPVIKIPHKRIRKKILNPAKRKRDSNGRFLGQKQPPLRTVLNPSKQPPGVAINPPNKSKQPRNVVTTTYPLNVVKSASKQTLSVASNQYKDLTSIEPVENRPSKKHSHKGKSKAKKPKIGASEKDFEQFIDVLKKKQEEVKSQ